MINKILLTLAISFSLIALFLAFNKEVQIVEVPSLGDAVTRYMNISTTASTTVFTLTTSSQRLLGTTTSPLNRVASLIQLASCTAVGTRVHLNIKNDIVATVSTGPVLVASTTEALSFNTYSNPVGNGAVTGITNSGTCTVVVTEWTALR